MINLSRSFKDILHILKSANDLININIATIVYLFLVKIGFKALFTAFPLCFCLTTKLKLGKWNFQLSEGPSPKVEYDLSNTMFLNQ